MLAATAKKAADDAAAAGVAMEVDEGDANGGDDGDEGEGEGEEDGRLEGTAVYLSPELVGGAAPSVAAGGSLIGSFGGAATTRSSGFVRASCWRPAASTSVW